MGSLAYIGKLILFRLIALKKQPDQKRIVQSLAILAVFCLLLIIGLFIVFMILWFFWFRTLYLPLFVKIGGAVLVAPYLGAAGAIFCLSKGIEFGLKTSKIDLLSGQ